MQLKSLAAAVLLGAAVTSSFAVDTPITITAGTGFFGASRTAGSFSDNFTFSPSATNFASSAVSSINIGGLQDVSFTSVRLTTGASFATTVATFTPTSTGAIELYTLASSPALSAGVTYAISVVGSVSGGSGSYSGTLNLNPVPEPETYALMLAGLFGIGLVAHRRKAG